MIINYYGAGCLRVQFGDKVVAFNPISKDFNQVKPVRFGADTALVSANVPACNGVEGLRSSTDGSMIIDGPGEYEIGGEFIEGFETVGPDRIINTVYTVELEGMNIVHLGLLTEQSLPDEVVEGLGSIDILFVPAGGLGSVQPQVAAKLAASLGAKLVIPVFPVDEKKAKDSFEIVAKELGGDKVKPLEKISLKRKDIENKTAEPLILAAQ
ncbi:MAG: MBL fold metallo-hydrolase [Patescibacteria group bacterium]